MNDSLMDKRIFLRALDPETDSQVFSQWQCDALYARLMDSEPARMYTREQMKDWYEKRIESIANFMICLKEDQRAIGFIELAGFDWHSGNAWLGIGIGEQEYWNKSYGSEAMQLILKLAFQEWNLHRVSLAVLGYNERAIRAYEKVGFKLEGALRGFVQRDGQRWDMPMMGVLRKEWEELQAVQKSKLGDAIT